MSETKNRHMTPEEFRLSGYAVVDWVARYMEEVEKYPVLSRVQPGRSRRCWAISTRSSSPA